MCRYITAVLPKEVDIKRLTPLLGKYGKSFEEIKNSSIESQLAGSHYVRATKSVCDCTSALGCKAQPQSDQHTDQTKNSEIAKLQKKGWSRHKIERWQAEREAVRERSKEESKDAQEQEIRQWRQFLEDLFAGSQCKQLGLILHTYSDTLEGAKIALKRHETLTLPEATSDILMSMEEDVLYTFVSQRN